MLPRCGRAAHICEANSILQSVFPAAIACFKTFKFRQSCIMSVKVVNSDKTTRQLQHTGRQKQGWNPCFCRTLKIVFPRSRIFCKVIFRCNCSTGTVARYLFTTKVSQGGAVLFAPPRKAVAFLTTPSVCQKHGTGISLPAGSDQGYSP